MKKIITQSKITRVPVTPEDFLRLLDIDETQLRKCLRLLPLLYKNILITKEDGGKRSISVPKDNLKIIQRAILDKFFSKIRLPICVYGFSKGRSIIENAKYHANSDYLLNLDIKNFFPSVHFEKVKQIYKDIGYDTIMSEILCKLTTYQYKLPQGAPTSPFLASFALNNLDFRLVNLAKKNYISYTRYFDDLCFSGSKRIMILEKDIVKIITQEGYKLKKAKRQLFSKSETKEINGISISDGKLFLKNTPDLQLYITELKQYGLSRSRSDNPEKERLSLLGKIMFLKKIDAEKADILKNEFDNIKW